MCTLLEKISLPVGTLVYKSVRRESDRLMSRYPPHSRSAARPPHTPSELREVHGSDGPGEDLHYVLGAVYTSKTGPGLFAFMTKSDAMYDAWEEKFSVLECQVVDPMPKPGTSDAGYYPRRTVDCYLASFQGSVCVAVPSLLVMHEIRGRPTWNL